MKKWFFLLLVIASAGTLHAQDTTLKEYAGKYIFPEGSYITSAEVTLKDSILNVNSAQGASDLAKRGKDTFALLSYDGAVYFKRDANGKVSGIIVDVQDLLLEGTKEAGSAWLQRKQPADLRKAAAVK